MVKLLITFVLSGEIWHGCTDADSLDEVAACLNVVVIQCIAIYRYINLMTHKDFYKNLATSMNSKYFDISTEKRRQLVDLWSRRTEKYLKLLLGLGNCTLAAWFIFPLVDELEYNMIIGIRLPFDYKTPLRYPFVYILVVIAFAYISHFVMLTNSIMQAHLIHLLCQFSVLVDCFKNLLSECRVGFEGIPMSDLVNNKEFAIKYSKRLNDLVEQHKIILRNSMNLRNILSLPMLGQLAASGTLICFVAYQTTTTVGESIVKCLTGCLFLGYNVFELFIICKWCEEITNWSMKIGEAVYSSGWERGLFKIPGVRATIMFVIARANKPVVLTAGGMYNLSIASCGSIIKTSYSALTVLLRFRH